MSSDEPKPESVSITTTIEETIQAEKYKVEYYTDPIHCYGFVVCDEYFVGEPYNIIIRVRKSENGNLNCCCDSKLFVMPSNAPGNGHHELFSVQISKKWFDNCMELYRLTQSVNTKQQELFNNAPVIKTNEDNYHEYFSIGLTNLNSGQFKESLVEFLKCIELKKDDYLSAYNIACCYSLLSNADEAFEWLNTSVTLGMLEVNHIENDTDLLFIRNDPRFTHVIEKVNHIKQERLKTFYSSVTKDKE
jgi:hypothetical protein